MTWSAKQYLAFEDERTRPARDLVAAIPLAHPRQAIDLGCGPGNSTEVLAARFPQAAISGLDNSPDMLAAARKRLPGLRFAEADIAAWTAAEPYDVVFANAALQWVGDHEALYPRLMRSVAEGGCLAVQTPDNLDEPVHRLMREIATEPPFAEKLAGAAGARAARLRAQWYYESLRPLCRSVDVWRTTYFHALADADAIVEWLKGTGLRPFLAPLDEAERAEFLARYRDAVARAHPELPGGGVLLPFPRLFIVATR
jgi:trans-aconitate 2-methyltransferase